MTLNIGKEDCDQLDLNQPKLIWDHSDGSSCRIRMFGEGF
jgi:hypothetical protein